MIVYVTDLYLQFSSKLQKVSINKSFIHALCEKNTLFCPKKVYVICERATGRTLGVDPPRSELSWVTTPLPGHIKIYVSGIFSKTKALSRYKFGSILKWKWERNNKVQLDN